ncbi:MAG TPA: hypothetical protein VHS56_01610 [Candidatus Cybelea sp.]|nr:hypothetical protein [Candidatus Cybelea sp.]
MALQSARLGCLQDMQGRASMFLTSVSGTLVALGFLGAADHFGRGFVLSAVTLLATLWVVGFFTLLRIGQIDLEDAIITFGIARIRHRYTEIEPSLQDRFVRSIHDDLRGLSADMGGGNARWWQGLMPTQSLVSFVASVIAGAEAAIIVTITVHAPLLVVAVSGILAGAINVLLFTRLTTKVWKNLEQHFPPHYPSPQK